MQRKQTLERTVKGTKMGKMPFQDKLPVKINPKGIEAAKAALPIFGGSAEDDSDPESPSTDSAPATKPSATTEADDDSSAGGDSASPPKDLTPEQIATMLDQIAEGRKKLEEATAKISDYETKEQKQARAQMNETEALKADLQDAQQTIAKMDGVIRYVAVINAIQENKDLEFHSARHVMRELNPDMFDLDVDLENSTATVSGIENELHRVARECDWLVKKNNRGDQSNGRRPRGSGSPPAPPNTDTGKASRRKALTEKWPVIAHGQAQMR